MKLITTRIFILICFCLYQNFDTIAQPTLKASDLIVIGRNTDGDDGFALAALADIPANSVIFITDEGFDTNGFTFDGSEDVFKWTIGSTKINAGTIIRFTNASTTSLTLIDTNHGTITHSNGSSDMNLLAGDQLFIYQTNNNSYNGTMQKLNTTNGNIEGGLIYAFNADNSTPSSYGWLSQGNHTSATSQFPIPLNYILTTYDGTGSASFANGNGMLTVGPLKNDIPDEKDNYIYDGPTTAASKTDWMIRIHTTSNWLGSDTEEYDLTSGSLSNDFSIITADNTPPTIKTNDTLYVVYGSESKYHGWLQATDTASADSLITYNLVSNLSYGHFVNVDDASTSIQSFTQQQLDENKIIYITDTIKSETEEFQFTITDENGNTSDSLDFVIKIYHNPIVNIISEITINEGDSVILSTTHFNVSDFDSPDDSITFYSPFASHGQITYSVPNPGIMHVPYNDVLNNQFKYIHNGSNTTVDSVAIAPYDHTAGTLSDPDSVKLERTRAFHDFNSLIYVKININPVDDDSPTPSINTGVTINENDTINITTSHLSYSDSDTDSTLLTYTITTSPENGYFALANDLSASISSFTQQNLIDGNLYYINNDDAAISDSIIFNVSDTASNTLANQSFNIEVNLVNDLPIVTTNETVTIDEGDTILITTDILNFSDADYNNDSLFFFSMIGTDNGKFVYEDLEEYNNQTLNTGIPLNETSPIPFFYLSWIKEGKIRYIHDHSNTITDSIEFTIIDNINIEVFFDSMMSDDSDYLENTYGNYSFSVFSVNINPIDDDTPTPSINTGVTINENDTINITTSHLSYSDSDTDSTLLTYTITTSPENGYFALANDLSASISSFTQQNLEDGNLYYINNDDTAISDSIIFNVSDTASNTLANQSFNIQINPVNDHPIVTTNETITIDEGDTILITTDILNFSDADYNNDSLFFFSMIGTDNGKFVYEDMNEFNNQTLNAGPGFNETSPIPFFYLSWIKEGKIRYIHDHSNTATDSIYFTIIDNINIEVLFDSMMSDSDYLENTYGNYSFSVFSVNINPVDDDTPTPSINTGVTINENDTINITTSHLSYSDSDTDSTLLTYTITTSPENGYFALANDLSASISSFTQQNLEDGNLYYINNDDTAISDSIIFNVSDTASNTLANQSFNIQINPINDLPIVTTNETITIDEGDTILITTDILNFSDADYNNDSLFFFSMIGTDNGKFVYEDMNEFNNQTLNAGPGFNETSPIPFFYLSWIKEGKIRYIHDHSNTATDSIYFTIIDNINIEVFFDSMMSNDSDYLENTYGNYSFSVFSVNINPIDDDTPTPSINTGVTINENDTINITTSHLSYSDSDTDSTLLTYTITTSPENGYFALANDLSASISSFTQQNLEDGNLYYINNDDTAISDSIIFNVSDTASNTLANQSFNIQINPINDLPIVTTNETVTIDEGASITLNNTYIDADDPDNNNNALLYWVMTPPEHGELIYLQVRSEKINNERINEGFRPYLSFHQSDLQLDLIRYVHDGSNSELDSIVFHVLDKSTLNGDQYSEVEDAYMESTRYVLYFNINPIDDDLPSIISNNDVIVNFNESAIITNSILNANDTESENHLLRFEITTPPNYGHIENVDNEGTNITSFTQQQLIDNKIRYEHDGTDNLIDSLIFKVIDLASNELIDQVLHFTINSPTSINSSILDDINYYPNPVSNTLNIKFNEIITGEIMVYTLDNRKVVHDSFIKKNQVSIGLEGFNKGFYLIAINSEKGQHSFKVLKD